MTQRNAHYPARYPSALRSPSRVRLSEESLITAVKLSRRYLRDRFLPDKAIDVLDEATARMRMQLESKPNAIDEMERQLIRLQGEADALRQKRLDGTTARHLPAVEQEATVLQACRGTQTTVAARARGSQFATYHEGARQSSDRVGSDSGSAR